jgi:hypothetical protein
MPDGSLSHKHNPTQLKKINGSCNCVVLTVQTYQELINRSCWLLEKGLSLGALRGLVWTVYQFCTMPTKIRE